MSLIRNLLAAAALLAPTYAFAGFGAIAYNAQTGVSAEGHGFATYAEAADEALAICGFGCYIVNWEENSCIAFARNGTQWGEAHGFADANSAIAAAVNSCGFGCAWQEWACN